MAEQNMTEQAQGWLTANVKEEVIDGRAQFALSARALWEWLEEPDGTFRLWWSRAKKRQQLQEGKDYTEAGFRINSDTKPQGGRPSKDYSLTHDAGRRIAATDSSPRGRALLRALLDLADRIEAGDPELTARMNRRYREVHGTSAPGEVIRWWSKRMQEHHRAHRRAVAQMASIVGPGCWTVYTATTVQTLELEDEIVEHGLPLKQNDRPDGSVGLCWANYRRKVADQHNLARVPKHHTAEITILTADGSVVVRTAFVYPACERWLFEHWHETEYLPKKVFPYLNRKYYDDYGRVVTASTADILNLRMTGRPACLDDDVREVLSRHRQRLVADGETGSTLGVPRVCAGGSRIPGLN